MSSLRAYSIIQLVVIALLGLGVVMSVSAGMDVSAKHGAGLTSVLLKRPIIYAFLAIVGMFIASRIDLRYLYQQRGWTNVIGWAMLVAFVLLLLVWVPGIGTPKNGSHRWIGLGPVTFQSSELTKWVMVLFVAWCVARRTGSMHRFWAGPAFPLCVVVGYVGLIAIADLGTAVLVGFVAVVLLWAGGMRVWQLLMGVPLALAGLAGLIWAEPYRLQRITSFFYGPVSIEADGYHLNQAKVAFASGGLFGRGLGNGWVKFGHLPEDTTDFILPVISEELGIAGVCLVIALYMTLMWQGMGVIQACRHPFLRMVGLGVLLTVLFQVTINLLVVTGLAPTKGIALCLISAGGSGWILTATSLGLLAAIDRINQEEAAAILGTYALKEAERSETASPDTDSAQLA